MNFPSADPYWLELAKWIALVWALMGVTAGAAWIATGFTMPRNAAKKRCEMDENKA